MRVEIDDEGVGLDGDVSPRQLPNDGGGFAVVQPGRDVERILVVGDADDGVLGGRLPFDGIALEEAADRLGRGPDRPRPGGRR